MALLHFTPRGIYCPQGDFYIDPWRPVSRAVITHGHGDHARSGMRHYLCHTHTAPVLRTRIADELSIQTLPYGEQIRINGVTLSLHPAGHIAGSAQVRLEVGGRVAVASGDYKLEADGIATPFELVRCHEFVTESTFGLPIYRWLPQQQLLEQMGKWIAGNRAAGKTSVFIAYSLGKAQRLMKGLAGYGHLYVHRSIARLNEALMSAGIALPHAEIWDPENAQPAGEIILLPPSLLGTNMIKKIPGVATAICSGWMQVRGSRRWQAVDAGFPVSDHADWYQLVETIRGTGAEKVYVTHGFTAALTRYLNETGIAAEVVPTQYGNDEEEPSENKAEDAP